MKKKHTLLWWSGSIPQVSNVVSPAYEIGVAKTGSYTYAGAIAEALNAPTASRVVLSGTFTVGQTITATLQGVTGDVSLGNCVWRFYGATDVQQAGEVLLSTVSNVSGAAATYVIVSGDAGKFIRAEVDIKGTGGEVGATIYSQYNTSSVPSAEFWSATSPFTIDGSHDLLQSGAGTGVAQANSGASKIIVAASDGIYGYDYNILTKNNGIAVGVGLASDSVTLAHMILGLVISTDSGGTGINVYEANVYKTTITNINPPGFGTTLRIQLRVSRSTNKITVYTSTDGAAYVLKYTYSGTLASSDVMLMARSTVDGAVVKGATLT